MGRKFNTEPLIAATAAISVAAWLILGLYFGTGGVCKLENDKLITEPESDTTKVEFEGIPYKNERHMHIAIENDEMNKIFPWTEKLPSFIDYLITACAFSLIGTLSRMFYDSSQGVTPISKSKFLSRPIFGVLTGILVLGITYVVPNIFLADRSPVNGATLVFISLFCGVFSEKFYSLISNAFSNLSTKKNDKSSTDKKLDGDNKSTSDGEPASG